MNLFFFYRENFHFYQKQKQLPDSGVKSEARSLQTEKRREKLAEYLGMCRIRKFCTIPACINEKNHWLNK